VSISSYSKAIAAFVTTAATTVVASLLVGSDGGTSITSTEWIGIAATTLIATAGVFLAPKNTPADPAEPPLID
jgi:hypothetical protein